MIEGINDATEARFRARLRELPDGTWSHRGYIEYDDIYPVVVEMTKRGDSLTFDYTRSADQAGAVINCTRPACVGATIAAILPYLCFDMSWSPAGLQRAVDVRTREGSVVHAAWPAGVSKATTTGSFMATISAGVCLSKLLAASEQYLDQFMSTWMGGLYVEDMFGVDQRGEYFGAAILDAMAGGSGRAPTPTVSTPADSSTRRQRSSPTSRTSSTATRCCTSRGTSRPTREGLASTAAATQ